jgi:hypothetical protein
MNLQSLFLLLFVAAAMPSCATIVSGSSDQVGFHSPADTEVYADAQLIGTGVCSGLVGRSWGAGDIYFRSDTWLCKHQVPRVFNGWYVGNLVFGGLIGLVLVDLPTGNLRKTPDGTIVACTMNESCTGEFGGTILEGPVTMSPKTTDPSQ